MADGLFEHDQVEVTDMTGVMTEGRQAVLTFVDHEHEELRTAIDWIHEITEGLAHLPVDQASASIQRVLHWVDADLRPHMAWEESWLFPEEVEDHARPLWATRLVRFDHRQIAAQADRLREHCPFGSRVRSSEVATLVADLAGFEALIRAHIEREERFIMPLLEPEGERWTAEWRD